jgi:ATPase subunit of ABC transporter with duplicated ATPase domains
LANAVHSFKGAVLLVSHDHHFVSESVGADSIIDMGKELDAGEELKDITA